MVVMKDAINHRIKASELRKGAYYLDLFMGNWASAVQDMRLVCDDTDPELKKARAAALKDRATGLAADLARFSEPIMERACNQGHIVTLPDLGCPVGLKYNFSGMDAHRFLWTYALLRIVFNRILWAVETILSGNNAASLDVEHQSFCRYIWMCLPFTLNVSPMAAILFSDPLFTSYEGARGAIKEYLLTTVIEIAQYRKRLSNDRDKVDNYLLATARAMTGREFFRERTDFPYWQQSSKVVME